MNMKILGLIENMSYFITPDTRKNMKYLVKVDLMNFQKNFKSLL